MPCRLLLLQFRNDQWQHSLVERLVAHGTRCSSSGLGPSALIAEAHQANGIEETTREQIQREALLRNLTILGRLGCLDAESMSKLRRGNAPTITRGPYAGELAHVDHIVPRSVVPELDNALFNLEFMPDTLNRRKSDKIGDRQRSLAWQWHAAGYSESA